jgi:hypothetical protein
MSSLNVSGFTTLNNNTTITSKLNVSGITTLNNNTNIQGVLSVGNGNLYGITNNYMAKGSLNIGDMNSDYGFGYQWTGNTAGLLMECLNNTEIAVHDSAHRVASLMSYNGAGNNTIRIGRDMGWGLSNLVIESPTMINNTTTLLSSLNVSGATTLNHNVSIYGILNVSGNTLLNNNTTINGSLNVSGTNIITALSNLQSSQWSNNGVDIAFNSGSVGLGINTPTQKLDVAGNIKTQQLYINNPNSTASIFFSPNPPIYSIFSKKVPWAMYFAEDYNTTTR